MKNTVVTFMEAKGESKLSMLTAYDYSTAKLIDQSGINGILVGDSLGMVELGYKNTLSVTMEEMIHHCKAVARAVENALLVCDMPFMSYQISLQEAVTNAGKLVAEGQAQAVKLEGGASFAKEIEAITRASIPVMGHIGLMPQSIQTTGGYRLQGKTLDDAKKLLADAKAVEEAGAFAIVLECVPAGLAKKITEKISIPTIGIGAGKDCDGQILVWQDMAGINEGKMPKFVRQFAQTGKMLKDAFAEYDRCVRAGEFPAPEHCYNVQTSEYDSL